MRQCTRDTARSYARSDANIITQALGVNETIRVGVSALDPRRDGLVGAHASLLRVGIRQEARRDMGLADFGSRSNDEDAHATSARCVDVERPTGQGKTGARLGWRNARRSRRGLRQAYDEAPEVLVAHEGCCSALDVARVHVAFAVIEPDGLERHAVLTQESADASILS